jgi:Flp pilus assembly protein TadD
VQIQWVRALELLGRTDESRAALEFCAQRFPGHPGILSELGKVAIREGDTIRAEEYLARAIARDPGNIATRYQYALVLGRNNKPDEAARVMETIHQLEADNETIGALIRKLQAAPNDANLHYEIAMISVRAGQADEALRWFQATLKVNPNHAPTHRVLAAYYQQAGDPILAARHRALAGGGGVAGKP